MSENHSDADLVARARVGEAEAFGQLYLRYFDPIFRYVRTRLPEAPDAEDMAETVFLRAFQALPGYRERGWPFSPSSIRWRGMRWQITTASGGRKPG